MCILSTVRSHVRALRRSSGCSTEGCARTVHPRDIGQVTRLWRPPNPSLLSFWRWSPPNFSRRRLLPPSVTRASFLLPFANAVRAKSEFSELSYPCSPLPRAYPHATTNLIRHTRPPLDRGVKSIRHASARERLLRRI